MHMQRHRHSELVHDPTGEGMRDQAGVQDNCDLMMGIVCIVLLLVSAWCKQDWQCTTSSLQDDWLQYLLNLHLQRVGFRLQTSPNTNCSYSAHAVV